MGFDRGRKGDRGGRGRDKRDGFFEESNTSERGGFAERGERWRLWPAAAVRRRRRR